MEQEQIEKLRIAIKKHVLISRKDATIIAYEDVKKKWLFDFRAIILKPAYLNTIAELFWKTYESKYPFQVGGLESAAIPLITAIVMKGVERGTPVNGFYIRKSRKKAGLTKMIEGTLTSDPVILVDDIINSGLTFTRQTAVLDEAGATISDIFILIHLQELSRYTYFKERSIRLHPVFSVTDFGLQYQTSDVTLTKQFDILWRFKSKDPNYYYVVPKSTPLLDHNNVYVGSDDGYMRALDQKKGSVLWEYKIKSFLNHKGIFSSPALHKDTIFFGGYDGNVHAVDIKKGTNKWLFSDADWVGSSPTIAPKLNSLFVGLEFGLWNKQGGIVSLDLKTGCKNWEYKMSDFVHSSPLYIAAENKVVVGCNDHHVYCFDAKTGALVWKHKTSGAVKESFAYDPKEKRLYFGSTNNGLKVISSVTGQVLDEFTTEVGVYGTPVIDDGVVLFAGLDKYLYCLDSLTLTERWKFKTAGRIFATPIILPGGHVGIGSNDGRFYEIDIASGDCVRFFQATERITNAAAFNPKTQRLYVPTYANEIYCLDYRNAEQS